MWLYSGPMDETRVNVAELSAKELLDEVRRLTHFIQEDSIPLLSPQTPFDSDHLPSEVRLALEYFPSISNDNLEDRDSSIPIESRTEEKADFEDEDDEPPNPEALSTDHRSFADDISDAAESNHDDDADHAAFVDAAPEKANVQPSKRPSGGFADEDDLFDLDEGLIEPPLKKAKTSSNKPAPAASEASAPATTPVAQLSTASSLSKGKEIPSTAVITASPPPSERPDLQTIITTLEAFSSQFTSLEADKIRLQKEVESTSSKLDNAVKIATEARQNADSLKEELKQMKSKLKDEEALRAATEAEKDNLLRQSTLALLKAADIPSDSLDKLPDNSPADALSMTIESNKIVEALLRKNKEVLSRMHAMIFPKASQEKTLEQLMDAFAVDTKDNIEVAHVPSFTESSSAGDAENDRLRQMRTRIHQLEQDMRVLHGMATIIKRKGELAIEAERYAMTELHKATESLNSLS
ncbi:hypothetical protein QYE76_059036 [Lolium multiflorum]|uniref:Uncharacterized protein n=1 Tax=Lolium multiflorum TaxID=4521 RepID=A0AAD8T6M9_LOLMU|nr:hypothetical protein QYE76_059036 [Lolium multiflorum]